MGGTHAPDRFHALHWGTHNGTNGMGLIAGGLTNGVVSIWDPKQIKDGEAAPLATATKHAGAVLGLEWNPSMTHLLASCGADAQLLIWDVQHAPSKPLSVYTPGARLKPLQEAMPCVAWNRAAAVPHILADALTNGACEIWDLKNKKQVITFHDTKRSQRGGQRSLAWHPTEPTIIIQACEDDASPVALVWDLKHYAAPVAVLQGHTKGLSCVSWSGTDVGVALTSSRDGSSILWDVPSATIRSHLSPVNETSHHVQTAWSPQVRAHLCSASSDGHIRVHAVTDPGPKGRQPAAKLGPPPAWLRRPCGASFGFGGRLIRFDGVSRTVCIQHISTDPELVSHAATLKEQTSSVDSLLAECDARAGAQGDGPVWALLAERLRGVDRATALLHVLDMKRSAVSENDQEKEDPAAAFEALAATPQLWGESEWEQKAGRLACLGDVSGAWRACADAGQWAAALLLAKQLGGEAEHDKARAAYSKRGAPKIVTGLLPLLTNTASLVSTGPLSEWKALAAAALSWNPNEANVKAHLSSLAARLRDAGETDASQLLLVAAEDLDTLAGLWTAKTTISQSVLRLVCANRAFGRTKAAHSSHLANCLVELADALAAQGDLKGALHWLEEIENPSQAPPHISLLYQRLRAFCAPVAASVPAPTATKPTSSNIGVRATVSPQPVSIVAPAPRPAPIPSVPVPTIPATKVAAFPVPVAHAPAPAPVVVPAPTLAAAAAPPVVASSKEPPLPSISSGGVPNEASAGACDRLTAAVEALGAENERAGKLSAEVSKRIPALRTKLESLQPAQWEPLVGLLDSFTNALRSGDANAAAQVYSDAQTHYHIQLGSTGMLALKRCLDLVKRT